MPDAIPQDAVTSPPASPPLAVLGMHRSGTSVLTGALALCGAWVGAEEELTQANPENPKGFWERRDLRAICNTLLASAGAEWWRVADFDPAAVPEDVRAAQQAAWAEVAAGLDARGAPWAVKEPRLCFVLPLLRPAMADPVCVLVHRDPLEVARSLQARNGFGILEGLALWEAYTRSALRVSADLKRVSVRYAELIAAPTETMAELVARLEGLGVAGLRAPDADALAGFVTLDLHRQHADADETAALLSPEQARLWAMIEAGEAEAAEAEAALSPVATALLRDLDARYATATDARRDAAALAQAATRIEDLTESRSKAKTALAAEVVKSARLEKDLATEVAKAERLEEDLAAATAKAARLEEELAATDEWAFRTQADLKERQRRIEDLEHEAGQLRRETDRLARDRKETKARLKAAQKELSKLLESTSWRVTAPLRVSGQAVKDVRRGALGRRFWDTMLGEKAPGDAGGRADRLRLWLERTRHERLLRGSSLFDPAWYLSEYPAVAETGHDPLRHFLAHARREGLNPSAGFDTVAYMKAYPEVARSGLNPLVHYLLHGRAAGYRITPAPARLSVAADTGFDPAAAQQWTAELRADPAHAALRPALEGLDDAHEGPGVEEAPLVSVIMPTRNRRALLPQAIESVRAQSYRRWELIVVDDGSIDGTGEMLAESFPDPRIRMVRTEGVGVSGARNAGLAQAQGALIAYLDSDNFWMPEYLELMAAEFERSGAACVYAVLKVREEAAGKPAAIWHRARPFDFEALKFSNYIDLNIFMHRAELVERYGAFDTALRRAVDWDLILRYVRHEKVSFANFVGAEYDHSDRDDRLTVRELFAFKNVVRNKHWIDWEEQAAGVEARDPDLVSVVMCLQSPVEETESRLKALFTHPAGRKFELILVDNGSDAVSKAILSEWCARERRIRVVENRENVQVALGSNLGLAASRGAVVVFLSDRVEVSPEWLRALVRPLKDAGVRGVQPKILEPDGTIRSTGLAFSRKDALPYPLHAGLPGDFEPSNRPRALAAVSGACAAFRACDLVAARGFYPIFSAEQQDADLCLRMGSGEAVFRFVPDAVVRHHPGGPRIRPARIEADRRQFTDLWGGRTPEPAEPEPPQAPPARLNGGAPAPVRAAELKGRTIALKIGCPRPEMKDHWGDYHFAVALAAAFLRKGLVARIDFAAAPDRHTSPSDINLVLRGRQRFEPKPGTLNLMWLISHPDRVSVEELRGFDHVFAASEVWTGAMAGTPGVFCEALLQCTDSSRFYPEAADPAVASRALFVANSRNVLRAVVREAIEQDLPIDIYGEMWADLAPAAWIRAEKIENVDLPRYYASAEVVLNDHWDSMRDNGFVSNRMFDVLACAAPLVTDRVVGLPPEIAAGCRFFGDGVPLSDAVEAARRDRVDARDRALALAERVRREHSFDARAAAIIAVIARLQAGGRTAVAQAPEMAGTPGDRMAS